MVLDLLDAHLVDLVGSWEGRLSATCSSARGVPRLEPNQVIIIMDEAFIKEDFLKIVARRVYSLVDWSFVVNWGEALATFE